MIAPLPEWVAEGGPCLIRAVLFRGRAHYTPATIEKIGPVLITVILDESRTERRFRTLDLTAHSGVHGDHAIELVPIGAEEQQGADERRTKFRLVLGDKR